LKGGPDNNVFSFLQESVPTGGRETGEKASIGHTELTKGSVFKADHELTGKQKLNCSLDCTGVHPFITKVWSVL
jgi:hypothetical protein